jgi:outer membrane protein TolC
MDDQTRALAALNASVRDLEQRTRDQGRDLEALRRRMDAADHTLKPPTKDQVMTQPVTHALETMREVILLSHELNLMRIMLDRGLATKEALEKKQAEYMNGTDRMNVAIAGVNRSDQALRDLWNEWKAEDQARSDREQGV